MTPSQTWGRQKEWPPKGVETKRKDFNQIIKIKNMSMKELREFAKEKQLKAKDTDKSELIDEIIKELEEK